jgi:hypothetical protein
LALCCTNFLARVHLLEHAKHVLEVVVVGEPDPRVLVVLLERDREAVCDVHHPCLAVRALARGRCGGFPRVALARDLLGPEQHTYHALVGVLGDAHVVVRRREQHERVHDA